MPKKLIKGTSTVTIIAALAAATGSMTYAASALAGNIEEYTYDAHGRLVQVVRCDDNAGQVTECDSADTTTDYTYDEADNRTDETTTNAPP